MKVNCGKGLRSVVAAALLFGAALAHAQSPQNTPPPPAAEIPPVAGEPVVAVRIVTEEGRVFSEAPGDVGMELGKPLDRARVGGGVTRVYRGGEYGDVRAISTPVAGGIRVDFVVREQLYFNQVLIHGLVSPPSEASAIAAMQLPLGEPYQRDTVNEGLEKLREVLRDEGFFTAKASADTVAHPGDHEMDVIISVQPGRRARVKEIQLKNVQEYRDGEMLSRLKMKPGREMTSSRLQGGTARIRKFLVKKGHLNARAVVHLGEYDANGNTVPLELEVTEGPRVQVTVTGAKFSRNELKTLVPVYQEGAVDTDLLEEGKRNIRERLERDGYFDAEVDYKTTTKEAKLSGGRKGTEEVITYRVERGDRHKLLGIEISGNHYFDTELLRSRLQIYGKSFATPAKFSRRLLESDRDSMRNLYLANGFLQAVVDTQMDNYRGKEGDLLIRFTIQEGKQTPVASLSIEDMHAFKEDILLGRIGSTPGQPYSEFNVATDRDSILALYFNEGFPEARFTSMAARGNAEANTGAMPKGNGKKPNAAKNGAQKNDSASAYAGDFMRLVYHIDEGPQTRVRRILLSGYTRTRPGVIRREVSVKPDAPLREGEVVESQRRLYNLGVFNRVTIQPQNPNGTDTNKDVV